VIDEFELTIVDADDRPVAVGVSGEITVRGREPGLVMNEYWASPEATAVAFRGGRFHTGDQGRLDEDNYLYFLGRIHDGIRRRGENISAYEVEQILLAHPEVVEAAALGVASDLTEHDVKVCVVLRAGSALTAEPLHAYCRANAPAFMVPRYIEILDELPKTPTQKVEKFKLTEVGGTVWDAAAG
jgi:crotonobetaine/carnitine-CoA ligase